MFYSIIPPTVAIIGAVMTKRIIPSLLLGLLSGTFLKSHTLTGTFYLAGDYLAGIVGNKDNANVILFLFSFGALTEMFKLGGGISGFARRAEKYVKNEKDLFTTVWLASLVTFMDCCFHVIATGTILFPLQEKFKGVKERLALIINTTSSQLIVLIPFATTYVGYLMGVISISMRRYDIGGNLYSLYFKSVFLNFYSITMLIISIILIFKKISFSNSKPKSWWIKRSQRVSEHNSEQAYEESRFDEKAPSRLLNLLLPLLFLLSSIVYMTWWTGGDKVPGFWDRFLTADFEKAIFVATLATLIFTGLYYAIQKIPVRKLEKSFIQGGVELLPPIIILVLAWSISEVIKDLGFNIFISNLIRSNFSRGLVPLILFLTGGVVSYFMGSAWGTWALVMPLAFSIVVSTGANLPLTLGAVLAGGSIGDNISPLGETPILTATVLKMPLEEHINYILPFGLIAAGISAAIYLILGYGFM